MLLSPPWEEHALASPLIPGGPIGPSRKMRDLWSRAVHKLGSKKNKCLLLCYINFVLVCIILAIADRYRDPQSSGACSPAHHPSSAHSWMIGVGRDWWMKVSLKKTARLLYIPPSPPHASHGPNDVGNLILYPWLLWGCRGLPGKPWQWSPGFGGHRTWASTPAWRCPRWRGWQGCLCVTADLEGRL